MDLIVPAPKEEFKDGLFYREFYCMNRTWYYVLPEQRFLRQLITRSTAVPTCNKTSPPSNKPTTTPHPTPSFLARVNRPRCSLERHHHYHHHHYHRSPTPNRIKMSNASKRALDSASADRMDVDDEDDGASSSTLSPFVCLPMYGEHKRAVSSVKLAPSRLTKHRENSALCASASADGSVKIWDLAGSAAQQQINQHNIHAQQQQQTTQLLPNPQQATTTATTQLAPPPVPPQPAAVQNQHVSSETIGAVISDTTTNSNSTTGRRSGTNSSYLLHPTSTLLGHSRGINEVAWSKGGDPFVATASDDKTLRLWDAQTGDALVEFRGHDNFVFCTQFNGPSNLLVSGSFDETVKLWDVRSGECVSTLPAHSDPVTAVSFNRDGTCVVSASHDGLIRIWDVSTGECLKTIFAAGNPPVSHVTYSPNGKYVLAGTLDSKLRLWPMELSGKSKCAKTYGSEQYHANTKYCIVSAFLVGSAAASSSSSLSSHIHARTKQRQCIVTGSETGDVVLYDIQSRKVQQVLDKVHTDVVLAVDAHDSKELIATGGMTLDRTVRFWAPADCTDMITGLATAAAPAAASSSSSSALHFNKKPRV
jgi:COMPASS component SWD3